LKLSSSNFIKSLGPGIITAALVLGPGSLTVASKLGSIFQYQLLWVVLISTVFMITFTVMSARYGYYHEKTLIESIRLKFGPLAGVLIGLSIFVVSISFQSGNAIGSGLAMQSITGTGSTVWIIIFSTLAILLLFFNSFYKILEKVMVGLVIVMLISFLITVIVSNTNWVLVIKGFVPSIPAGSEILSIAIVATSFSVAGAFYQSYLVQAKSKKTGFDDCKVESITGIVLLGFISSLVVIASGNVLYSSGISVNNVADMGKALEPLFGTTSSMIFMIGLLAASFSSLVGNATLGGNILADTLGLGKSHKEWTTRIFIMLLIVIGSSLAITFSSLRLKLIVFAQSFTVLIVPVIAFAILSITSSKSVMGPNVNTPTIRAIAIIGNICLIALAGIYAYLIYFKN